MSTRKRSHVVPVVLLSLGLVLSAPPHRAHAEEFTNPVCGYRVTFPKGWQAWGGKELSPYGGLIVANYPPDRTVEGQLVPPGGARITIQMFPPYMVPFRQWHQQGLDDNDVLTALEAGHTIIVRKPAARGRPARITALDSLLKIRSVDAIVHKGRKTFALMLWCGTDDPHCPGYEHVLDEVIASITFVRATPPPWTPTP